MEKQLIKIIKFLNKNKVKYLLIGGYAVVLYGVERSTFDIDIGISMSSGEIKRVMNLLSKIGFKKVENLEGGVRLTDKNVKLDLMFIEEPKFDFFYQYRKVIKYGGTNINLPSILDLIRMKESSSRFKDKQDAQTLRFILMTRTHKI